MNLQLKDFEGPLDLLLHLVRVNQMNIYEVKSPILRYFLLVLCTFYCIFITGYTVTHFF